MDVRLPTGAVQRCHNEQIKRRVEADDDQIIEEEQQPPVNGEQQEDQRNPEHEQGNPDGLPVEELARPKRVI